MAKKSQDPNAIYAFVGEGEGIPGLPHELTIAEAEASGMADILAAAIERGTYRAKKVPVIPAPEKEKEV